MKKLFKKLFKRRKKDPRKVVLILALLAVAIAVAINQFGLPDFTPRSSGNLSYDEARFAVVDEEGNSTFLEKKPTFKIGDPVIFALLNVGPFEKGEDGLNFVDMDLVVTGPDKEVVLEQLSLLGAGGHLELENDMAPSPNGVFIGASDLEPGKYTMNLIVYDKISGAQVSEKGTFILEEWAEEEIMPESGLSEEGNTLKTTVEVVE